MGARTSLFRRKIVHNLRHLHCLSRIIAASPVSKPVLRSIYLRRVNQSQNIVENVKTLSGKSFDSEILVSFSQWEDQLINLDAFICGSRNWLRKRTKGKRTNRESDWQYFVYNHLVNTCELQYSSGIGPREINIIRCGFE